MREIRKSGSEGGGTTSELPTPIELGAGCPCYGGFTVRKAKMAVLWEGCVYSKLKTTFPALPAFISSIAR